MDDKFPPLYSYSFNEARKQNRLDLWQVSHNANVACKEAIESILRFNGKWDFIPESTAKDLLEAFGFKRMNWVLAASIQRRKNEPFSESARQWAQNNYRPLGTSGSLSTRVKEFTVQSPVKALECLVSKTQAQYQALGLFGIQHCEKGAWSEDLEGKVLILSPDSLKECYWEPKNQLWLAEGGFGCSPNAAGRAVYATCLGDGEHTRWDRSDFVGVIREECMPEWAKESLAHLRPQQQVDAPTMNGMTMK